MSSTAGLGQRSVQLRAMSQGFWDWPEVDAREQNKHMVTPPPHTLPFFHLKYFQKDTVTMISIKPFTDNFSWIPVKISGRSEVTKMVVKVSWQRAGTMAVNNVI